MSADNEPPPMHPNPRPGVLKALGIANIVFAVIGGACLAWSGFFYVAASAVPAAKAPGQVEVVVSSAPTKATGMPITAGFNPFMVFEDKHFVRWSYVENGASLLLNGLMFATGIGLLNLRRWAGPLVGLGGVGRIVSAVGLWGYYIVAVAPGFSELLARDVAGMFAAQGLPPGRAPSVADLTRVYSIMNLILAVGAIAFSSIYPVISLWLLGRRGWRRRSSTGPAWSVNSRDRRLDALVRPLGRPGMLAGVAPRVADLGPDAPRDRGWVGRLRGGLVVVDRPAIRPGPSAILRAPTALLIVEGMVAAFAMVMAPAVLAGSLAGEKERGSIGLLLTTRVTSADIVLGRLSGRLSQVAMIELAALPPLLMIASMAAWAGARP